MDTFVKQFNRLPPKKQREFIRAWGERPWETVTMNQPEKRVAWKRDLFPLPDWPRWQDAAIHAESPLWMALRAKNRRAAKEMLERRPSLTREEAGQCVLLTLQWAPDLLEEILDRVSGGPFYWLRHEITLRWKKSMQLRLQGSFVMIAAALDDLPALELLLTRGAPADYQLQRDRWGIVRDLLMDGVTMGALHSPDYSVHHVEKVAFPDDSSHTLLHADPLSAAIFCNAKRCAVRLLQEPSVVVTDGVRRALAIVPENETQKLVAQHFGVPLEELLQPEDFGPELTHSAFLPVLRRCGQLPRQYLEQLIKQYSAASDPVCQARQMEVLSMIDPELLGDVVWQTWRNNRGNEDLLKLARELKLPLDRCRVEERTSLEMIKILMDSFQIVGNPPEGGMSGLAAALLGLLGKWVHGRSVSVEQLLHIPGAVQVLRTEDPKLLLDWLNSHSDVPATKALTLQSLLSIQKEVRYDL